MNKLCLGRVVEKMFYDLRNIAIWWYVSSGYVFSSHQYDSTCS